MKLFGNRRRAAYRARRRAPWNGKRKNMLAAALALLLLALSGMAAANTARRPVPARQELPAQTAPPRRSRRPGVYNILLLGADQDGTRTDTLIVASLDTQKKRAALFSLPRDTPVLRADGTLCKLNALYGGTDAGIERLRQSVQSMLGVPLDGYVLVGMDTFVHAVDALGGLRFCVPQDMDYDDPAQGLSIHLKQGEQQLTGAQTLQLVRFRSGYAAQDIRRTQVQQAVLKALAEQAARPENAAKLAALLLREAKTDLSLSALAALARGLLACELSETQTATPAGTSVRIGAESYYPLFEEQVLSLVNRLLNPYDCAVQAQDLALITPDRARAIQKEGNIR